VLVVSSPGVLGPITGEPADENAPIAPSNAYERSKAAAEKLARTYPAAIIVRPEFVYGPGDTHVLGLFRAVKRGVFFFVGTGKHTCHPTFISDAVAGMLLCIEKGRPGLIYQVAGPRPVTFRELGCTIAAALEVRPPWMMVPRPFALLGAYGLEALGSVIGRTPPLSRAGVAFFGESRRFSWQKARRELGYRPQVELAEGVGKTVAWYRERGVL
jgi:nucleoside-diphosphate-sugar epimerase